MADDILDLGSYDTFPFNANWAKQAKTTIPLIRYYQQYRATSADIEQVIADVPMSVEMGFTLDSKQDEDTYLDFIHGKRGKVGKFWVKHPKSFFELKSFAGVGSTALVTYPNQFNLQYQGYERFYIIVTNGDMITRKITSVTYNVVTDDVTLQFANPTDRDLSPTDIVTWGRMLLVRFDDDTFEIEGETDYISEISLRFTELVQEYS